MKITIVHMFSATSVMKSFSNRSAVPRIGDHLTINDCANWLVKEVVWDALLEGVTVYIE